MAKAVDALLRDQGFKLAVIGINSADGDAITALGFRPDVIGLREQPPGIERDHVDRQTLREDGVRDRLILNAEAGGENDAAIDRRAQQRQTGGEIAACECGCEPRQCAAIALANRQRVLVHRCAGTAMPCPF